jgi:hypothetical protein
VRGGVVRRPEGLGARGDLPKGGGQPGRIAGEERAVRIGQQLPPAGHREPDQLGEQRGQRGQHQPGDGDDRAQAPAAVAAASGPVGTATRIIGWGQTCPTRGCGSAPTIANELDTSILADSRCLGIDGPVEICTNNTNGNAGACYGDSGGPEVRLVSGRWNLIGATSRSGNGSAVCATGPSIYGDLPAIRSWINTQVGGLPS